MKQLTRPSGLDAASFFFRTPSRNLLKNRQFHEKSCNGLRQSLRFPDHPHLDVVAVEHRRDEVYPEPRRLRRGQEAVLRGEGRRDEAGPFLQVVAVDAFQDEHDSSSLRDRLRLFRLFHNLETILEELHKGFRRDREASMLPADQVQRTMRVYAIKRQRLEQP